MIPRLGCLAAAALLAAAFAAFAENRPPLPERHVAERVLIQPRPGLPLAEIDRILRPYGGRRAQVIRQINVHVIDLPSQANAVAVAEALGRNRHLKFAEVDGVLEPDFTPDDPQYAGAWHLPKIGAPAAWDGAQGAGVTIAVLDSGVDATHPDLAERMVPGWNFYDNNGDITDVYGHGTKVAGSAAAAGHNSLGIASVSFRSRIMPMRVTDTQGYGYFSMMAAALTRAADEGARVANISFRGVSTSASVDAAAQYMRGKGGVVVVSGGNTGALRTDPKRASLTAVSATDSSDRRASFSSWGDYIDIAAPGVGILTTLRGGGYGSFSGTSASSPVVAGAYALLLSVKPGLAPATLDQLVFSTALDLGAAGVDQEFGAGRLDAAAAMAKATQTTVTDSQPPSVAILSPTSGTASGLVPVDVAASDDVGVTRVELFANNALVATDTGAPYAFTVDASAYPDGPLALQARAYDATGNTGTSQAVTLQVANDTVPPTVAILSPAGGSSVGGIVTVSVAAFDDRKVAKVSLEIDGREVALSYGASLKYDWKVPRGKGKNAGESTLTARAEDASGNTAAATVRVTRD